MGQVPDSRWPPSLSTRQLRPRLVRALVALRKRARERVRRPGVANAIVRPAPGRDHRRDSDVAIPIVSAALVGREKQSSGAADGALLDHA